MIMSNLDWRFRLGGIAPVRLIWRLLFLALALLLTACGSLPPRGEVPLSSALTAATTTSLARVAAASRPADESQSSGFRVLSVGEFAFDARVALSRRVAPSSHWTFSITTFIATKLDARC